MKAMIMGWLLMPLSALHAGYAPTYTLDERVPLEVTTATVTPYYEPSNAGLSVRPDGGIGRTYRRLTADELRLRRHLVDDSNGRLLTALPSGFDLWDGVRLLDGKPLSGVIASWEIASPKDMRVVIAFGTDDGAILYQESLPIFGIIGSRDFLKGQNLCSVILHSGVNHFSLLCLRSEAITRIPSNHWDPEWSLAVSVYQTETSAWKYSRSRNFHFLDTPIVASLDQIHVDPTLAGYSKVELYDLQGNSVGKGLVGDEGIVAWTQEPLGPFIGFLSINSQDTEGVISTAGVPLEEVAISHLVSSGTNRLTDAWHSRLEHLLESRFRAQRDHWWARKAVISCIMASINPDDARLIPLMNKYKAASIKLRAYKSHIDGTTQYYRYTSRPHGDNAPRAAIIIIPTVGSTTRPYLESSQVANIRDTEDIASVAEECSVDVIWPGIVDVDYGGEFLRVEVDECVADARELEVFSHDTIYPYGTCSAGIAALGYAETRSVGGLLLQIPMVARSRYSWIRGLSVDDAHYPNSVLSREQTVTQFKKLLRTPVYLVFDWDFPGHGDLALSHRLCDSLLAAGTPITQVWPRDISQPLWGSHARDEIVPMFTWAASQQLTRNLPQISSTVPMLTDVETVKEALLTGFSVDGITDATEIEWVNGWSKRWEQYRGCPLPSHNAGDEQRPSIVSKVLSSRDIDAINDTSFVEGKPQYSSLNKIALTSESSIWGFRLINENQKPRVQIFKSPGATTDLPKLDPVIDGCCKGAIWTRRNDGWVLVNVWI